MDSSFNSEASSTPPSPQSPFSSDFPPGPGFGFPNNAPSPTALLLRRWLILAHAALTRDFPAAQAAAVLADHTHVALLQCLRDQTVEIRAAAVHALGCLFSGADGAEHSYGRLESDLHLANEVRSREGLRSARRSRGARAERGPGDEGGMHGGGTAVLILVLWCSFW